MSGSRWNQVQALFLEALERDPVERPAWVRAKAPDENVADEVLTLLAAHDRPSPFDALARVQDERDASEEAPTGSRFGRWEVVGELGRGGMGVVLRVRRADGEYDQEGALKVLPRELMGGVAEARLVAERQILAGLAHPNIAPLLDGGRGLDGRPFFVMEHVPGIPLDRYCDERRMDTRARLRLFLAVCAAVQYAHQNLVVHRDLKPSNILVTPDGIPKLLDFGIAKLLTEEASGPAGATTQVGSRLLTPEYASPEQLRGSTITTASDVYQLGVLLYVVLTGRHPFGQDPQPAHRADSSADARATPPSRCFVADGTDVQGRAETRRATPERLRRQLAGDLDAIVLKALRPEPGHRYGTAGQLAEDVRRHLDRRPVVARRDTVVYRTGKLLRRHGTVVAVLVGAFLSVGGFAVGAQRQARETALERDRAQQVVDFLVELFANADPYRTRGAELTVREVLDRGAERAQTELKEQPMVRATLLEAIAEAYRSLGHLDTSVDLRAEALDARRRSLGPDSPELSTYVAKVAFLEAETGDFEAADTLLHLASILLRAGEPGASEDRAVALNDLGHAWQVRGDIDSAEPLLEESLRIREHLGTAPALTAPVLNNLGNLRQARGDLDSAAVLLRRSVEARRTQAPDDPRLAASLESLADVLQRIGTLDEADQVAAEALDIRRRTLPPGHAYLAGSLHILGMIMRSRGRPADAEPLLREALEIRAAALGEGHFVVAYARNGLALVLEELGRLDEAEELFRQSLSVYADRFGADHINPVYVEANLARLLFRKGAEEEGRTRLEHALLIARRELPNDRVFAADLITLGLSYCGAGSAEAADSTLAEAVEALRPPPGEDAADDFVRALNAHGSCLYSFGEHDRAAGILVESLRASYDRPDDDPYRAFALQVLEDMGRSPGPDRPEPPGGST